MAGRKGSTDFGLMIFTLMVMSRLFGIVDAENHSSSLLRGSSSPAFDSSVKLEKMSFNENWNSDAPATCTCTCNYPVPEAPPKAPSQRSPGGRKMAPPPAPYYQSPPPSSPVYDNPAPPTGSTKSPVSFSSPPPPAPYDDGRPAPVVAAPETFVPSPPPPPIY